MTEKSSREKLAYAFAGLSLGLLIFASTIAAGLNVGAANAQAATSSQDAATRVAQNKEYLTKARAAFEKLKTETNATEIAKLQNEIRTLEKLNMKLYEMDPELEARLHAAEKQLIEKYLDVNSTTYIGDNPVAIIFTDLLRRTVVVIVDPERIAETGPIEIEDQVDGIPVRVVETAVEDISCVSNSRLEECRPLVGGISIREQSKIGTTPFDTLGYKATYSGNVGFVLAGHSAVANLKYIIQPYDENKVVGQVQRYCSSSTCDFAWARASTGISVYDDICMGSTSCSGGYDISGKTAGADQPIGGFVIKSGAKTGNTLGEVRNNCCASYNVATIYTEPGDSGSPIFYESGGNANLYGLITSRFFYDGEWQAKYWPQDYIQTTIGAIASTS